MHKPVFAHEPYLAVIRENSKESVQAVLCLRLAAKTVRGGHDAGSARSAQLGGRRLRCINRG